MHWAVHYEGGEVGGGGSWDCLMKDNGICNGGLAYVKPKSVALGLLNRIIHGMSNSDGPKRTCMQMMRSNLIIILHMIIQRRI